VSNNFLYKGEQFLQTLWVGGLLSIGYLAVPILFHSLDDRRLAGELAGHMFSVMNVIGFVCGGTLLLSSLIAVKGGWLKARRVQVLLAMLTIVAVGAFVMQPMMQELKAAGLVEGSEAAAQFGKLHGISSMLYLVNSLLGIYLVIQARPGERVPS
jgi:Domain of unknown function (DUF4149)